MGLSPTVPAIVEGLGDGYWLLDARDGLVMQVGTNAADQAGRAPAELIGSIFSMLLDPPMPRADWDRIVSSLPDESVVRYDVALAAADAHAAPHPTTLILAHGSPGSTIVAVTRSVDEPSTTDTLTGLRTRQQVIVDLQEHIRVGRGRGARVGALHLDLDEFESFNATFGPAVADRVLAQVAQRLQSLVDDPSTPEVVSAGRVGSDEFLIVVTDDAPAIAFDTSLALLAEQLQRSVAEDLDLDALELRATASLGISRWPGDGHDAAELLTAASRALGEARSEGRHQVRFHEPARRARANEALDLDRELRQAAARRELEVHYQPIIDLRTGAVAAAEALVRWNHPRHGPIAPSVFIPTAEATGSITAISDLVMGTVAEDLASWDEQSLLPDGARVAINVSAAEFTHSGFVDRVSATLDNAGVSPQRVEFEITETLLMDDLDATAERLRGLDERGFLVALDDFGTGYSSLSYLHSLPLHTLKIDRCFVGDLHDGRSETITRAILSLARSLGIVAVGEGVETEHQRHFLVDAGCDLVQGYYYAPPLPRPAFERFLHDLGAGTPEPAL